jgi:hypothetical protein
VCVRNNGGGCSGNVAVCTSSLRGRVRSGTEQSDAAIQSVGLEWKVSGVTLDCFAPLAMTDKVDYFARSAMTVEEGGCCALYPLLTLTFCSRV